MKRERRRVPNTAAQVGLLVVVALLVSCQGRFRHDFESRKPNPVLVIGIDGATWDLINPMIEDGDLPTFDRLKRSGAYGQLLSLQPLSSPVVWTTIATGRFPRDHNILDHTYPYVEGEKKKISSTLRREPTLWNIASEDNRTVGVVNWFATHPPEVVNGAFISDRAAEGVDGASYPARVGDLTAAVLKGLSSKESRRAIMERFLPWRFDPSARDRPKDKYHRVSKVITNRIDTRSVYDEIVRRLSRQIIGEGMDLCMTYFRLIDHASHASWIYFDSSEFPELPNSFDQALLKDLIPESYRYMDEILDDLVEHAGDETNIVIVSDHGFGPWHKEGNDLTGNHKRNGLFLAVGPDIQPGEIHGISTIDLTTTILALTNLPVSRELPGRIEVELFRDGYLDDHPVRWVDAYDIEWQSTGEAEISEEVEEEALKTLRALGYLGQSSTSKEMVPNQSPTDFWEVEPELRRRALMGELTYYVLQEDEPRWRSLVDLIRAQDPENYWEIIKKTGAEIRWFQRHLPLGVPGKDSMTEFWSLVEEARIQSVSAPSVDSGD